MILWLVLFLLVVGISFVLAFRSMRQDYLEVPPQSTQYGLFLIRKTSALKIEVLDSLHEATINEGLIISLERLFKGSKSALVIFGPKNILLNFADKMDLLELEDYTNTSQENIQAWEVGIKKTTNKMGKIDLFKDLPVLQEDEQMWWQIVLQAKMQKGNQLVFQSQIRVVLLATDPSRIKELTQNLQNLAAPYLIKLPKAFTNQQILTFYKQRSLDYKSSHPLLNFSDILQLSQLAS